MLSEYEALAIGGKIGKREIEMLVQSLQHENLEKQYDPGMTDAEY